MNNIKVNKETIKNSATRFFEEKALVRSYLKGKISKEKLNDKRVKLKLPL